MHARPPLHFQEAATALQIAGFLISSSRRTGNDRKARRLRRGAAVGGAWIAGASPTQSLLWIRLITTS